LRPAEQWQPNVAHIAALAFTLQVFVIYFFNGLHKWNPTWHSGEAVGIALHYLYFPTWLGEILNTCVPFTRAASYGTLALELLGPFLLLIPFRRAACRGLFVVLFASFHIGIAALLDVGLFPWVAVAILAAFIPSVWWDRLSIETPVIAREGKSHRLPFWSGVLACFAMLLVLHQSARKKWPGALPALPASAQTVLSALGLKQGWIQFDRPQPVGFATIIVEDEKGNRYHGLSDARDALPQPLAVPPTMNLLDRSLRHRQIKLVIDIGRGGRYQAIASKRLLQIVCETTGAKVAAVSAQMYYLWRKFGQDAPTFGRGESLRCGGDRTVAYPPRHDHSVGVESAKNSPTNWRWR
jgi:hypothetical protein